MTSRSRLLVALTLGTLQWAPPFANSADLPSIGGGYSIPLNSMQGSRTASTTVQQFDFSCGSAALATLLTFHYHYPVSEQLVFEEMFLNGDQALIRKAGFSLLDMKNYLAKHGFIADGFQQELDQLAEAKLPAIVLVSEKGYQHFVVIKGVRGQRILIGDPASGTRSIDRQRFKELWTNRLLFVIHNRVDGVRFNESADWHAAPTAPVGVNSMSTLRTISLPNIGPGDF